jgi:hypothetical protein
VRGACWALTASLLLSLIDARRSEAVSLLPPGFFMEYRVESFSEGRRSEERFRLLVREDLGADRRLLELSLNSGSTYRAVYQTAPGPAGPFAAERFERVEGREDGQWQPLVPADIELLALLSAMQERIERSHPVADSSLTVGGQAWRAQGHALADTSETVQRSASVTLTRQVLAQGRAWVAPELPFGGWLLYEEERRARKISELGGRRFVGEEETSRELWTLVDLGPATPNK